MTSPGKKSYFRYIFLPSGEFIAEFYSRPSIGNRMYLYWRKERLLVTANKLSRVIFLMKLKTKRSTKLRTHEPTKKNTIIHEICHEFIWFHSNIIKQLLLFFNQYNDSDTVTFGSVNIVFLGQLNQCINLKNSSDCTLTVQ